MVAYRSTTSAGIDKRGCSSLPLSFETQDSRSEFVSVVRTNMIMNTCTWLTCPPFYQFNTRELPTLPRCRVNSRFAPDLTRETRISEAALFILFMLRYESSSSPFYIPALKPITCEIVFIHSLTNKRWFQPWKTRGSVWWDRTYESIQGCAAVRVGHGSEFDSVAVLCDREKGEATSRRQNAEYYTIKISQWSPVDWRKTRSMSSTRASEVKPSLCWTYQSAPNVFVRLFCFIHSQVPSFRWTAFSVFGVESWQL